MPLGEVVSKWKHAATIILANSKNRKVLMLKRGSTASFMPNSLVFPGGVVEESDKHFGHADRVCALRELFEESGIVLTKTGHITSLSDNKLQQIKEDIRKNAADVSKISDHFSLDRLIAWESFLTPASYPKRYYTTFFVSVIDDEPKVDLCKSEMADYCWIDPKQCVSDAFKGKLTLPPPQVYSLTRMAQVSDWKNLESFANTERIICPQPIKTKQSSIISNVFPGDHLYIEDDCFHQPARHMDENEVSVDKNLPTHRAVYDSKPIYDKCRIYMHKLLEKDAKMFHMFDTHSAQL